MDSEKGRVINWIFNLILLTTLTVEMVLPKTLEHTYSSDKGSWLVLTAAMPAFASRTFLFLGFWGLAHPFFHWWILALNILKHLVAHSQILAWQLICPDPCQKLSSQRAIISFIPSPKYWQNQKYRIIHSQHLFIQKYVLSTFYVPGSRETVMNKMEISLLKVLSFWWGRRTVNKQTK